MDMNWFDIYLIGINILGFLVFLVNHILYCKTADGQIDSVVTIVSFLGGSLGIIIGILIFERKPEKQNMMSRVFIACMFVIQVVIVLIVKGVIAEQISLAFWDFFHRHMWLVYYLIAINIIAFALYAKDKVNACEHRSRFRIVTLLGIAFVGGSIGSIAAMYLFRHKTQKDYFTVGIPLIMIMQVVVLLYIMNIG